MGSNCGKCAQEREVEERANKRVMHRKKVVSPASVWEEQYTLKMEYFTVPTDRLLVNLQRYNVGARCRAAGITVIMLEKKDTESNKPFPSNRLSKLNSVLYTPVLQWFDVDVKQQIPKYLPMNLWPGCYTVFGFYEPEEHEHSHVSLSGKIGLEEVDLEEPMDTGRILSAEDWKCLCDQLERELQKIFPDVTKETVATEQQPIIGPRKETLRDSVVQRESLDTGYRSMSSRTQSIEQLPYTALKYSHSVTSDSDDGTVKEFSRTDIKQGKLRRKDTPSHCGPALALKIAKQFGSYKKQADEYPLDEESETSDDIKMPTNPNMATALKMTRIGCMDNATIPEVITVKSLGSSPIDPQLKGRHGIPHDLDSSTGIPYRLTKSCQDLSILTGESDHPSEQTTGNPDLLKLDPVEHTPPTPHRKKKKSLACKISKMNPVGKEYQPERGESPKTVEVDDDADDEYELSLSECSKLRPNDDTPTLSGNIRRSVSADYTRRIDMSGVASALGFHKDSQEWHPTDGGEDEERNSETRKVEGCGDDTDDAIDGSDVKIGQKRDDDKGDADKMSASHEVSINIESAEGVVKACADNESYRPRSRLSNYADSGADADDKKSKHSPGEKRKKSSKSKKRSSSEKSKSSSSDKWKSSSESATPDNPIETDRGIAEGEEQSQDGATQDAKIKAEADAYIKRYKTPESTRGSIIADHSDDGTAVQKKQRQTREDLPDVCKSMDASDKGTEDKVVKDEPLSEGRGRKKSDQIFKTKEHKKKFSYSNITEAQKLPTPTAGIVNQTLTSVGQALDNMEDFRDATSASRHMKSLKTQSIGKVHMPERRNSSTNLFSSSNIAEGGKATHMDGKRKTGKSKLHIKVTEVAQTADADVRKQRKSFSMVSRPAMQQQNTRRKMRQSLESGAPLSAVPPEDKGERAVSKPIHAFVTEKQS